MKAIIGTLVFYFAICLLLVYFASKIDANKSARFCMFMLILVLTLVSGLRHYTVGIDTPGYVSLISMLRGRYLPQLNNITEQGFIFLSFLLVNASKGYTLALVVYSLITNSLIVLRLYDYREKISFTWSIFIYYMVFYFCSFNTIRQWIAMALVFYGTRYAGKNNIKFLAFALLAVLMHTTAVFAVFYVPLYYFSLPSKNGKDLIRKNIMILFVIFIGIYVYTSFTNKYEEYITSTVYGEVSWLYIVMLAFVCFIILYDHNGQIIIWKKGINTDCDAEESIRFETLAFFFGIIVTLMVFLTRYADRIGQYFLLFELVFFSYYIKKERTRAITIIFVCLVCICLRFSSFLASGYGEVPYIPFWL